ncbi:MAG: divalent-cation tolerance protein CutA [Helicobacteraceae bacterium]|nr:divalent-cation tolerance protein CutA [Helicobacteraceae bacterium]
MIVAMTTVDSEEAAKRLAGLLVKNRLAACVSIAPNISSVYWWNGEIETSSEWLLIIKTAAERIPAIEEFFKTAHTYELPELIFAEFESSVRYGDWISDSLDGS